MEMNDFNFELVIFVKKISLIYKIFNEKSCQVTMIFENFCLLMQEPAFYKGKYFTLREILTKLKIIIESL